MTALTLLAKLGEGTVLHVRGGDQESLRRGVAWLRAQLDKKGRIGLRTDPDWLLDHALACYVLTETLRTSVAMRQLVPDVTAAVDALRMQAETVRPAPGTELRLWCDMLTRSLRQGVAGRNAEPGAEAAQALSAAADALAASVAALPPVVAESPREQAAQWLREVLAGGEGKDVSAKTWLDEPLRDPLTSFYAFTALYVRGGKSYQDASGRLLPNLRGRQVKEGEHQGSWDPVGDFGVENGRYGTTAVAVLLLQIYYRYSHLEVCQ